MPSRSGSGKAVNVYRPPKSKPKPPPRLVDPIRAKGGKPAPAAPKLPTRNPAPAKPRYIPTVSGRKGRGKGKKPAQSYDPTYPETKSTRRQIAGRKHFARTLFNPGMSNPNLNKFARQTLWTEPHKLAEGNMKAVSDELSQKLGRDKPEVVFNGRPPKHQERVAAYVYPGENKIYINPALSMMTQYGHAKGNDSGYSVLAHEMRHTNQSVNMNREKAEGQAVVYQQDKGEPALKKMGLKGNLRYKQTRKYRIAAKKYRRYG